MSTQLHSFSPLSGQGEEEGLSLAAILRLYADGEISMAEAVKLTGLAERTLWAYINSPLTRACVGYRNGNSRDLRAG